MAYTRIQTPFIYTYKNINETKNSILNITKVEKINLYI